MSLLTFENVSKSYSSGLGERVVLHDASLEINHGELVTIWGRRRSGRSTLLRIAAAMEAPDAGIVRFEGRDSTARRSAMLGAGIGYCRKSFHPADGQTVLEHLEIGQIARGISSSSARSRAIAALERVDAGQGAALRLSELDSAEAVRVAIARALAHEPKLLVIDEPTIGVDLPARDPILLLLRSLANEGVAVLASTGETTGLSGVDRAFSLSKGELRGTSTPGLAPVVPLRRPA